MYKNLRKYIDTLDRAGELIVVDVFVDPQLEIAEITDRVSKSQGGGKALLFTNTGTPFPVVTNLMGSDKRIALALGVESLDEISTRISDMLRSLTSPKVTLGDKLKMLPMLGEMSRWLPRQIRGAGDCQQVVWFGDAAELSMLPILKCWAHDGGAFVTLPLVNTIDPDTGARNVGMYRMQVMSENTTGMHWHTHKTGERHYRAYQRRGEIMPVSVCLGGDPAYTYAATAPMPDNMDEYLLAGFLRRKPVELVKCLTNDIYVPSDCDFVLEGYVDPTQEKVIEGPFGDHTGFYSLEDRYPVFHVTAITHRTDAVYPATIVGVPPQEDAYIAKATEKIFLEPIRFAMQPEVCDLYMPEAGVAHNIAVVSIEKNYIGQGFKVASSMWGAGQMMFNKFMVVCPDSANIRNPEALALMLRNADMGEDTLFSKGVLDVLDHATKTCGYGGKLCLDLTTTRAEKGANVPETLALGELFTVADVRFVKTWGALLLVCSAEADNGAVRVAVRQFLDANDVRGVNYIVVVDSAQAQLTPEHMLWQVCGNCDPTRDMFLYAGALVADGRPKISDSADNPLRFPNVVVADDVTISLVDGRWSEYGIGEFVLSPSLKLKKLLFSNSAAK